MIDTAAAVLAIRNRILGVSVATTGSVSLGATATNTSTGLATYTRASGSFITDGLYQGMEFTAAGFGTAANNGKGLIAGVTATVLTVYPYDVTSTTNTVATRTMVDEAASSGRTISVGLPGLRAWENVELIPVTGKPYVEEDFVLAPAEQITAPYNGGKILETGIYVLKLYGVENYGSFAIRKALGAIKALLAPGTSLTAGSNTLEVPGTGPSEAALQSTGDGWTVGVLTVPWRAWTRNAVAA